MPYGQHLAHCLHCGATFICGDDIPLICLACEVAGHRGIPLIGGMDGSPPCPKCPQPRTDNRQEGADCDA